jgi:hypothetical protein
MKIIYIKKMIVKDGFKLMERNGEKHGLIKQKKCQETVMKQEKQLTRHLININYSIHHSKVVN